MGTIEIGESFIDLPIVYHTSWQELAMVGKSIAGITFAVQKDNEKNCWVQVKYSPDGKQLSRAQITQGTTMTKHEFYLYEQHCPGGKFYNRLRLATSVDFKENKDLTR